MTRAPTRGPSDKDTAVWRGLQSISRTFSCHFAYCHETTLSCGRNPLPGAPCMDMSLVPTAAAKLMYTVYSWYHMQFLLHAMLFCCCCCFFCCSCSCCCGQRLVALVLVAVDMLLLVVIVIATTRCQSLFEQTLLLAAF